jgi:Ribbon-helix-helix protein, copG family
MHDQTWQQYRQGQERSEERARQWRPPKPIPVEETVAGRKLAHDALVAAGLRQPDDGGPIPKPPERQLLVRMPVELHAKLQAEAKRRDLSQAQLLRRAIEWYLDGGVTTTNAPSATVSGEEREPDA